ncbi:hypothetical protein GLOIN_2v1774660 [Rhizophagus irregularis DAOM 181602=DAOM 197198]|nr:hypothetical protein GLOIN_2v1774660 [Rhizophagus irregularis DAOM 181602=DAOM 197198]
MIILFIVHSHLVNYQCILLEDAPHMSQSLKQSKLRLASDKIVKENLSNELKNVRLQRNELKESSLQNIQPQPFGIEVASDIFDKLLGT